MSYRVPFSGRSIAYTQDEIDVVVQAMRDAEPLTQGRYLRAFEANFAAYLGAEGPCFALCNATAALEICAQLCCFEPGDEFVVPGLTFTATAYPFVKKGGRPVWADVDPQTHVVTAETIARCLTPRTKAIVVVHLYGYVADMPAIAALARERGVLLIEDAAQSIGARLDGRHSGTFGDLGVFSLHSHKNITTLGEGGVLCVRDPEVAKLIPLVRHNGHCAFDFERPNYWTPAMGNVALPRFRGETLAPNNYCLGEIECALGSKLLARLDRINEEKRARALAFVDALADHEEIEFLRDESDRHNYHLLACQIHEERPGTRDAFMEKMATEKGVQCIVQYYPLYRYDFYRDQGFGDAQCPNTDAFFDSMVSFPFHHHLNDEDRAYMLSSTREVLRSIAGATA